MKLKKEHYLYNTYRKTKGHTSVHCNKNDITYGKFKECIK